MKYLSLFSGIGGFELGIEQSNLEAECVGHSEIDKYAEQVYSNHFNNKNYGDAKEIEPKELPEFDMLTGGFPCQSFSIAGKRGGFEDTRGTLFFEIARIAKEKLPKILFLENVKGLLNHADGATFRKILSTLDELGYDVEWQVFNSKNFGVPQNRERVFIIGHLRGESRPEVFPIKKTTEKNLKEITSGESQGDRVYDTEGLSITLAGQAGGLGAKTGLYLNPKIVAQRGRYNENGEVEQQAEPREDDNTNTLTGVQKDNYVVKKTRSTRPWEEAKVSPTLRDGYKGDKMAVENGLVRKLTPVECERLQGFPDGWAEGLSDTQRYKCLGNAVTVNVIKAIANKLAP